MNIEIANRLQKLRKENGYSQEELADKLGISRQAVSKWERAESSPDTDNLIILARLYNMSLDELLYDSESDDEIRERTIDKENENTESIHISDGTIKLTDDEGQTLEISDGHIKFKDKDNKDIKMDTKRKILSVIDGVILCATLLGFVLWGVFADGWAISWILWVIMPAVMSIGEAIAYKQITKFIYPLLVTALYLFLGMQYSLWHPYWFLFLTIPAFYIIFEPIDKYVLKTKKDDEYDEDDEYC